MAPSWMTTKNSSRNSADTFSFTNSSTRIMWPVEEMGSHSVMPSTTPMKNAFRTSMNMSTETASVRFACLSARAASGNPGQSAPPTREKRTRGTPSFEPRKCYHGTANRQDSYEESPRLSLWSTEAPASPAFAARDTTRRVARAAHSTMACARSRFHVRYNIASRFVFPAQILFSKATMRQRTPSIVVIKLSKIALLPTMSVPLGYHGTPARDRKRNVFPARQTQLSTQQASPSSWRSGALRHNPRRTDVLASSRMRPPTEGSPPSDKRILSC